MKKWNRPLTRMTALSASMLLAIMTFSISANAVTYTLAQLIEGQDFTIGTAQFTGWALDTNDTSADPTQITVDTIDTPGFPGFQVNGNGELVGDEATLVYTFTVVTTDLRPIIAGGFLDLSDFDATSEGEITIDLLETSEASGLELAVFVNNGNDTQLKDAGALEALVNTIVLQASVKLDLGRDAGTVAVNNYTTQIVLLSGSDKPELTDLTISEGTLSPTFAGDTREYDTTVPFDTTSMSVTATADEGTTLTLNGQPLTSDVASPPQNLSVGANELTILLTAADATESSYTLVVTRQSEDAPTVEFTGSNATGIRNLMVGGVLYNVEFVDGDTTSVYGPYPGEFDFPDPVPSGGDPAIDAVNAIVATLATEPSIVTVGPGSSQVFYVGFQSFTAPASAETEPIEWVNSSIAYYLEAGWDVPTPESSLYQKLTTFADFTEVGSETEGPILSITNSAPDEVTITWTPDTPGFVLQESTNLTTNVWVNASSGTNNPAVLPADQPAKSFRLEAPF